MFRRAFVSLFQALLALALLMGAPASSLGHGQAVASGWAGGANDTSAAKHVRRLEAVDRVLSHRLDGDDTPDGVNFTHPTEPWPPVAVAGDAERSADLVFRTHAARAGPTRGPPTA